MQLSIIIVNYNVKYFLEQCLCSVIKACNNLNAEIIVVDNNSTDGSNDYFNGRFPTVQFIWRTENTGFAKANNLALQYCSGEYILFLNPDTILAEDSLEKSIQFIQQQKSAGGLGVRLIDGSGKFLKESKRSFPSPLTSLFKLTGLTALFPHSKIFARYYLGNLDEHKSYEVDVLVGAFMMMPKKILNITGGFDESFFMYGEDIDLSYRIQKAGFKNYYFSGTSVIHFKGESTTKESAAYIRTFYQAMILFVKKHYSGGKAGSFSVLMQLAIWLRALISGIAGVVKKVLSGLKNIFTVKKSLPKKVIIISDESAYSLLCKQFGPSKKVIAHFSNCSVLISSIKNISADEIIFFEGNISFKEIIEAIQQLPDNVSFMFHSENSNSIVGSDNKNTSGNFISLDK